SHTLLQKSLDLGAVGNAGAAAESGALDRRPGGCKAHRLGLSLALGEGQGEGAVPGVAGGERVDGRDREGGAMHGLSGLDRADAAIAEGDREPGTAGRRE